MTVWSVMLGTMIGMFDFIKQLPYPESFLGGSTLRNLIIHVVCTLICYVLCCIRNTKYPLTTFFSLDNFILFHGLVFLLWSFPMWLSWGKIHDDFSFIRYGIATIPIRFDSSLLFAKSTKDFFSNIGVAPYTLGYNFCFLTYYV